MTDELARQRTLLAPSATPCSLSPLISRIHSSLFSDWRRTVSSKFFDTQVPSISTKELVLPRHARYVLSRLRYNKHSLLLSSYLSRIRRIENPSCSACEHSSQDTSHLILHCPATESLRRSLFGDSLSLYDLWSRSWEVARLLPCPHPSEGVGSGNQQQQHVAIGRYLEPSKMHSMLPFRGKTVMLFTVKLEHCYVKTSFGDTNTANKVLFKFLYL